MLKGSFAAVSGELLSGEWKTECLL